MLSSTTSADFDHHQLGGNGTRADGIPYASCGLLWKEYGPQLCDNTANPERAFAMMDAKLISGIDANDTGYISPKDCPPGMSVSAVISGFNPRWDEKTSADEKFLMALQMAETIFDNTFASICSTIAAEAAVEEAIETSPEEDVGRAYPFPASTVTCVSRVRKSGRVSRQMNSVV